MPDQYLKANLRFASSWVPASIHVASLPMFRRPQIAKCTSDETQMRLDEQTISAGDTPMTSRCQRLTGHD